jgi:hypothetical protein
MKKSYYFDRIITNSNLLKGHINGIFRSAKKHHSSHTSILDRLHNEIYDSNKYKALPPLHRNTIQGYIDAQFDVMYEHLEWCHWYNGKFVGRDLPYGNDFKQELINKSSHVYIGSEDCYS